MADKHLEQGEGGATRTKRTGSHLDPKGPTGAFKKGKGISERGGNIPPNVPKGSSRQGDHLVPPRPWVAGPKTAERSGGTPRGHDRTNPTAGRGNAGDKNKPKIG